MSGGQTGRYSGRPTGGDPFAGKYKNGRIPFSALRRCQSQPASLGSKGYLSPDGALCVDYMTAAAARDGVGLNLVTGYRDLAGQVAAKKYWTDLGKPAFAAKPGTSKHGLAAATDWDTSDPRVTAWLDDHGADYGWDSPMWAEDGVSPDERWHRQFIVGFKPEDCATRPIAIIINGQKVDPQGAYYDRTQARNYGPLAAVRDALGLHYGPPHDGAVAVRRGNIIHRLAPATVRAGQTWIPLGELHRFPGVLLSWRDSTSTLEITG